jgi:hypothetical protein
MAGRFLTQYCRMLVGEIADERLAEQPLGWRQSSGLDSRSPGVDGGPLGVTLPFRFGGNLTPQNVRMPFRFGGNLTVLA